MTELSRLTGVKLKYLYSVAIDAMLGHGNLDRVVKGAWELQRQTREDIAGVGARHTQDTIRAWHENRDRGTAARGRSRHRKHGDAVG